MRGSDGVWYGSDMKLKPPYRTEADLCSAFIKWAEPQGWTAYPETGGWDILLVKPDGTQFGIQAKLKLNIKLLCQSIPGMWSKVGPDRRGMLVGNDPGCDDFFEFIGIHGFYPSRWRREKDFGQFMPDLEHAVMDWNPDQRRELTKYIPDVVAGASAPVQLTHWKISALRACAILEINGSISAKEIKAIGIDPRRWTNPASRWLVPTDERGRYVAGDKLRFKEQHPKVYAEILAEEKAK